ncbi:hypothetical protein FisN_2Lh447 [Fistulifera solaris]|uniref:2Fe-2S ferredoxin-type domain-containing protein n=1 Tax=Fistulifera solaris TaxID=1519565 RepID=A0A1Z5JPB1_FISSO|nr:hypothetical protein FisN_2Lh447 [Fistulifera solaris]|eukprot:GAX15834.1 hypothetical protein FisN_2Lh447 [Fistulifera solaris]
MRSLSASVMLWLYYCCLYPVASFSLHQLSAPLTSSSSTTTRLYSTKEARPGYQPKWKKKATLAEQMGGTPSDLSQIGLKGDIPVVFQQGNVTKSTVAFAGQPLRDVATQAGQYIRYGCGKGECGTCECMVDGQWIRPCVATIPPRASQDAPPYMVRLKEQTTKTVSSGKFYTARSFVLGFWNNLLGMVGFVKARRDAKRSWEERLEYEELIRVKTLEKRQARLERELAAQLKEEKANGSCSNLSP